MAMTMIMESRFHIFLAMRFTSSNNAQQHENIQANKNADAQQYDFGSGIIKQHQVPPDLAFAATCWVNVF